MSDSEDLFGNDDAYETLEEEYEQHKSAIFDLVTDYAQEVGIGDEELYLIFADLAITTRLVTYTVSAEKPSAAGARLDLDRAARDYAQMIRDAKKSAGNVVAALRTIMEERVGEESEDPED